MDEKDRTVETVADRRVDAIPESSPPAPMKIAEDTVAKADLSNEAALWLLDFDATLRQLIWQGSDPYKRTISTSDEAADSPPGPHTDDITQTIGADVPVEKLAELDDEVALELAYRGGA